MSNQGEQLLEDSQIFSQVDQYIVYRTIVGRGSTAHVRLAKNILTNEQCCVKILKNIEQSGGLGTIQQRECNMSTVLKSLKHENLVQILDVVIKGSEVYIFMEECQQNLTDYCNKNKMNTNQIKEFIQQIVEGYLFLEKNHIIHRDLKPDNILIMENDRTIYKIGDFGYVKNLQRFEMACTKSVGTPKYMAPEVEKNNYTNKCDVYSLGIIILEMLVGKEIFKIEHKAQLKGRSVDEIFQKEFEQFDDFFKNLLKKMIIYLWYSRSNWAQLKDEMGESKSANQNTTIQLQSPGQFQNFNLKNMVAQNQFSHKEKQISFQPNFNQPQRQINFRFFTPLVGGVNFKIENQTHQKWQTANNAKNQQQIFQPQQNTFPQNINNVPYHQAPQQQFTFKPKQFNFNCQNNPVFQQQNFNQKIWPFVQQAQKK